MCNKGDLLGPDMRARLAACEVNKESKNDLFHALTPPLDAKKLQFARYISERARNGKPLRLSVVDIRKAYFNGIPRRDVFMSIPKGVGLLAHLVARHIRCVYGTRDAGIIWKYCYRSALEDMGFISGIASPCCVQDPT